MFFNAIVILHMDFEYILMLLNNEYSHIAPLNEMSIFERIYKK